MGWTDTQRRAVEHKAGNLLVSAAAGSGKTSVLAARVAALVEAGTDVRSILVCTFTNQAAQEMRTRISRAIYARARTTGDRRLLEQAEYAVSADISTIHSFAIRVVRENFHAAGVPHDVRVGGAEETAVLRRRAMEAAFDELYEEEDEDFLLLRGRYGKRTDEGLAHLLDDVYAFAMSRPEGVRWVQEACAADRIPLLWAALDAHVRRRLARAEEMLLAAQEFSQQMGWEAQTVRDQEDAAALAALTAAWDAGDEAAFARALDETVFTTKVRALRPREMSDRLTESYKKPAKAIVKELGKLNLADARARLARENDWLAREAHALFSVLTRFVACYEAQKRERNVMDFDDILHLANNVLEDDEVAQTYRARYAHVFVDEYQDTNPIQEQLLARVSRLDNRFLVGDLKQSIYRFRQADPSIFLDRSREYRDGRVVHMNDNFRSADEVVACVNEVMRVLMSPSLGEISYTEEEHMHARAGKSGGVELLLTRFAAAEEEDLKATEAEARQIAMRIRRMLGEPLAAGDEARRIGYGDIAVLLRATRGRADVFSRVFEECGIPVSTAERATGALPEIEVFVNLLRVVEGETSDIALLSVLRSHIVGLEERELADIRLAAPDGTIWQALHARAAGEDALALRLGEFEKELAAYRLLYRGMSLVDFLTTLKNRTHYAAAMEAMPGGQERAYRFSAFFERLLECAAGQESLFTLLAQLDEHKRQEGVYINIPAAGSGESVRIMSVHASKGLEFPVVIFAGLSTVFNTRDFARGMLLHPKLGIAADRIDAGRHTRTPTLTKQIFKFVLEQEMKSEELRILYVAMTRAKDRLILSGTVKDADRLFDACSHASSAAALLSEKSMLEWVLTALLRSECMRDWSRRGELCPGVQIAHSLKDPPDLSRVRRQAASGAQVVLEAAAALPAQPFLSYTRPAVPAEVGVSSLLPTYLPDGDAPGAGPATGVGGKELGTLVHLLLEHVDFSCRTRSEIEALIDRMYARALLNAEEAALLRGFGGEIEALLKSDMADRIRAAQEVRREVPFILSVPACELGWQGEGDVLVQGIIDLLFQEEDGWVLLDYKTNRVRAENEAALVAHYRRQLELYARAWSEITGEKVKEKHLYFLRAGRSLALF